jgi:hypothetical protein
MRGSKPGAMKHRAAASDDAAVKDCTAAFKTSAAVETVTSTAMTAVDFGRQPVGGVFRYRRSTRIDQRQRFCALASYGRQHQHRGSRKAHTTDKASDKAAPGIRNLRHV